MAETTEAFLKEQLEQFDTFMKNSKDLIKRAADVQEQAQKTYHQMDDTIKQFTRLVDDG